MDAVARYDAEGEVRLVLEHRVWRRDRDVCKKHVFGMDRNGSVDCGDDRHWNIEQICKDLFALAIDLVVPAGGEEVEALGIDAIDEGLACAGQDDHPVGRVLADLVEELDKLFMDVAIEDQRAAVRVEHDLEHALLRTRQPGMRKCVLVGLESSHRPAPFINVPGRVRQRAAAWRPDIRGAGAAAPGGPGRRSARAPRSTGPPTPTAPGPRPRTR